MELPSSSNLPSLIYESRSFHSHTLNVFVMEEINLIKYLHKLARSGNLQIVCSQRGRSADLFLACILLLMFACVIHRR